MWRAAQTGSAKRIKRALAAGANVNAEDMDHEKTTALFYAVAGQHIRATQALLEHGARPNDLSPEDAVALPGVTPLMLAAQADSTALIDLLIEHGALVDLADSGGFAPLDFAAQWGSADAVERLLHHGADANALIEGTGGQTALMISAYAGQLEVAKRLVEVADINVDVTDNKGATALMLAAQNGHPEIVRYLLGRNASANIKDTNGATPLLLVAQVGHAKVAQILVTHGRADVNQQDRRGQTPLLIAAIKNKVATVKVLLLLGATVDTASDRGVTPLVIAAREGYTRVVQLLLKYGASPRDRNHHGQSALDLARYYGHKETVAVILAAADGEEMTAESVTDSADDPLIRVSADEGLTYVRADAADEMEMYTPDGVIYETTDNLGPTEAETVAQISVQIQAKELVAEGLEEGVTPAMVQKMAAFKALSDEHDVELKKALENGIDQAWETIDGHRAVEEEKGTTGDNPPNFSQMRVKELKNLLAERGINTDGYGDKMELANKAKQSWHLPVKATKKPPRGETKRERKGRLGKTHAKEEKQTTGRRKKASRPAGATAPADADTTSDTSGPRASAWTSDYEPGEYVYMHKENEGKDPEDRSSGEKLPTICSHELDPATFSVLPPAKQEITESLCKKFALAHMQVEISRHHACGGECPDRITFLDSFYMEHRRASTLALIDVAEAERKVRCRRLECIMFANTSDTAESRFSINNTSEGAPYSDRPSNCLGGRGSPRQPVGPAAESSDNGPRRACRACCRCHRPDRANV
jgi:ankyrin repeat protein